MNDNILQVRARRGRDQRPDFSAEFLDADDDHASTEGNLGAIKRNFRKVKQSAALLRGGSGRSHGGSSRRGHEDRSDDELAEEARFQFTPVALAHTLPLYSSAMLANDGSSMNDRGNAFVSHPLLQVHANLHCLTLHTHRANSTISLKRKRSRRLRVVRICFKIARKRKKCRPQKRRGGRGEEKGAVTGYN